MSAYQQLTTANLGVSQELRACRKALVTATHGPAVCDAHRRPWTVQRDHSAAKPQPNERLIKPQRREETQRRSEVLKTLLKLHDSYRYHCRVEEGEVISKQQITEGTKKVCWIECSVLIWMQ